MNNLKTIALAGAVALWSQNVDAESSSEILASDNLSNQVKISQESISNQTNLLLEMEKSGLFMPWEKLTSKQVRETLLNYGINPTLIEWIEIVDYVPTTLNELDFISKGEIFWDKFTVENISTKLEEIAKQMNLEFWSQYNEWDWTQVIEDMNPNEDEAEVLNSYVDLLPSKVDALTAWQGATKLIAVKRFANHPEQVSAKQKETMEFLLADNIYGIISALRPDLLKDVKKLVLPKNLEGKSYTFIESNYEIVSVINKLLPKEDKIWAERITDFAEVYAEVLKKVEKNM